MTDLPGAGLSGATTASLEAVTAPRHETAVALSGAAHDLNAVISRLFVYPVKSCAGIEVREAILTETGLEFDRAWMVVDAHGEFLTQRQLPRMALIQPKLRHYDMVLRAPGMLALHIALDQVEQPAQVRLWDENVKAYDMGPIAAQWFTDFLGQPARLVRFDPEQKRLSSFDWTAGVEAQNQFNDGYPLLLTSEASLQGLNEKLVAGGSKAVGMERFRPNIVIGEAPDAVGSLAAHDEDRLESLQVSTEQGFLHLKPVKPCARCPIPDVDPLTAEVNPVVGDTLRSYRQDARVEGAPTVGMNVIVLNTPHQDHLLKVGQSVAASWLFD